MEFFELLHWLVRSFACCGSIHYIDMITSVQVTYGKQLKTNWMGYIMMMRRLWEQLPCFPFPIYAY